MLECADGSTSFVIWLTQKNRERAKKYFEVLGVDPELLKDPGLYRASADSTSHAEVPAREAIDRGRRPPG